MPQITKKEYIQRAMNFVEAHKEFYTEREYNCLMRNIAWGMDNPFSWDIIRQVLEEVGYHENNPNIYDGFLSIIENNFDINNDIVEIAGGIVPSLAKKIALKQKSGTVTVYDPRLITNIEKPDNLILKREQFNKDTPLGNAKLVIGFMPCDATIPMIKSAGENKTDFIVALCEGGMREGYGWLEEDDEWIDFVKYIAECAIEENNLGILQQASLKQYKNPYPVLYNKRKKS